MRGRREECLKEGGKVSWGVGREQLTNGLNYHGIHFVWAEFQFVARETA